MLSARTIIDVLLDFLLEKTYETALKMIFLAPFFLGFHFSIYSLLPVNYYHVEYIVSPLIFLLISYSSWCFLLIRGFVFDGGGL